MIMKDDWCAIRYIAYITKQTGARITQHTMDFVNFTDNPDPIGAHVIEGWALSDSPLSEK